MPNPNAVIVPEQVSVQIRLDPVQTMISSMVMMIRSEDLSGLGSWIYETYGAFTQAERERHYLVTIGLHYAVLPNRYWADVPSYLNFLETCQPETLRDQILDAYLSYADCIEEDTGLTATREQLLEDEAFFLEYLERGFSEAIIDLEVEKQAYKLIQNPVEMQELIFTHINSFWKEYFQAEWERTRPLLEDAVQAFDNYDFSGLSRAEIVQEVVGRDLKEKQYPLDREDLQQLVFVPSLHVGPYLGKFEYKNAFGLVYGARLPRKSKIQAPDLSRNEITIRLSALADDIRLQILKLVAEEGEQRSPEIIEKLGLSQSAASRHLTQLSATGYLAERRCSGSKCYQLNPERIHDTLAAVEHFLLDD